MDKRTSYSPTFAAAFSRNSEPSRIYRRTTAELRCPVWFMMARSLAPSKVRNRAYSEAVGRARILPSVSPKKGGRHPNIAPRHPPPKQWQQQPWPATQEEVRALRPKRVINNKRVLVLTMRLRW